MDDFNWISEKPKYKTDDDVFVIDIIKGKPKILKTKIRNIPLELWYIDNQYCFKFKNYYDLSEITSRNDSEQIGWCHSKYVFGDLEEAESAAKFWLVNRSKEDWITAIGDRKIKDGHGNIEDGCDLQSCCAAISEIRDSLENVRKYNGICEIDRLELQELLNSHECPININNSILGSILDSMNLIWKPQKHHLIY